MCLYLVSLYLCSIFPVLYQCQDVLTTIILQLYSKLKPAGGRPPDLFFQDSLLHFYIQFRIMTANFHQKKKATLVLSKDTLSLQISLRRTDNLTIWLFQCINIYYLSIYNSLFRFSLISLLLFLIMEKFYTYFIRFITRHLMLFNTIIMLIISIFQLFPATT